MGSFRFMDLPLELRGHIYKLCLVVPGNVVHYPEYYSHDRLNDYKDRKLTDFLSILYVSKQVHEEAAPIFYSKNTFRVTATTIDLKNGGILEKWEDWSYGTSQWWDEPFEIDTVWVRKGHLIRHAAVYYHQQDVDPQEAVLRSEEAHEDQLLTGVARLNLLHEESCEAMTEVFMVKGYALSHLRNLATLDIDIKWLYCPIGCCRDDVVKDLWRELTDWLGSLPRHLEIKIHGVRGEIEGDDAEKWRRAMLGAIRKHKVETDEAKAKKKEEAKAELEKAEAELEEAQTKLEKAEAELEEAQANLAKAEVEREDAEAEWEEADAELDKAKTKMEEAVK